MPGTWAAPSWVSEFASERPVSTSSAAGLGRCAQQILLDCQVALVVSDSAAPQTVARQASLSMEFSRQEHWKMGVLLQGIFLTQESNLHLFYRLLHCRWILYP